MKIRPISDIHLEFGSFDLPYMEDEEDQVLCILGDLNPSKYFHNIRNSVQQSTKSFFNSIKGRFKKILYIPGNHEYYHSDIAIEDKKFYEFCDLFDIEFLNGDYTIVDDVVFIGCILWTDFDNKNPLTMNEAQYTMSDYKHIYNSHRLKDELHLQGTFYTPKLIPENTLLEHYRYRTFIFDTIKQVREYSKDTKVVVLSHHAPHFNSIHEKFKTSKLNGAYYSNLENEILEFKPNLWLHGHVHNSFNYNIEEAKVVCNPRGYNVYEENKEFNPELIIEI